LDNYTSVQTQRQRYDGDGPLLIAADPSDMSRRSCDAAVDDDDADVRARLTSVTFAAPGMTSPALFFNDVP
jgi:hypothetical protein